jgi:ferredoxin
VMRPPGSRPEPEFLARCIRCGVCMTACPTNTLQPREPAGGFFSLISPMIVPRIGPCEPDCNICGQVCPTAAIRSLPMAERRWAKTGTAVILRNQCIVWEHDRKCLVCDEVCPYDAVELRRVDGKPYRVPFVIENRCSGCGYCEYHCPVKPAAAIVVQAPGEIRISTGSLQNAAIAAGLDLTRNREPLTGDTEKYPWPNGDPGPTGGTNLPPGFSTYPKTKQ